MLVTRMIFIFLFLLNLCLCLSGSAQSLEEGVPDRDVYRIAAVGEECAVFRALAGRAEQEVAGAKRQMAENLTALQQRQDALMTCAKSRSLDLSAGELLAEVCPQAFQRWIVGGAENRALREELQEATLAYREVDSRLKRRCTSLPAGAMSKDDGQPMLEFF